MALYLGFGLHRHTWGRVAFAEAAHRAVTHPPTALQYLRFPLRRDVDNCPGLTFCAVHAACGLPAPENRHCSRLPVFPTSSDTRRAAVRAQRVSLSQSCIKRGYDEAAHARRTGRRRHCVTYHASDCGSSRAARWRGESFSAASRRSAGRGQRRADHACCFTPGERAPRGARALTGGFGFLARLPGAGIGRAGIVQVYPPRRFAFTASRSG